MAKHMVKCKYCGVQFDANVEAFIMPSARRYAHTKCHEDYEKNRTQESRDEEAFYNYVKKLFQDDYNFITTKKLAKQYIKENGYTYSGMLKSLIWFYEIQHNSIDKSNGSIGIIPYIYNKAKNYYYSLYMAKNANQTKDINLYIPNVKQIIIEEPKAIIKSKRLFNMEDS